MNSGKRIARATAVVLGLAIIVGSWAIAGQTEEKSAAGQPEMKLPPGWTEEDMQACMLAGTPGKMHEYLAQSVGAWSGTTTMWMGPEGEPATSSTAFTVSLMMDGRFTKVEMTGEMPGMGTHHGLGIYGFDNVSERFVSSWIDNHGTGIIQGIGSLSDDGKTITWKYTYNCPVTQKPAVLREIETLVGPNHKTLEAFGTDPKSGQEYKMMLIDITRKPEATRAGA